MSVISMHTGRGAAMALCTLLALSACGGDSGSGGETTANAPQQRDAAPTAVDRGREIFRFETFGNQGFWTSAMRLPQGIEDSGMTPLRALEMGLNINTAALAPQQAEALRNAAARIEAGADPADTVLAEPTRLNAWLNQGAVIGLVPFRADGERKPLGSSDGFTGGGLNLAAGDRLGVSCALCHASTDGDVLAPGVAGAGSAGQPVDGVIARDLDVGALFATANNPLAYLPLLQLRLDQPDAGGDDDQGGLLDGLLPSGPEPEPYDGVTVGRGDFAGIPADGTLEEATAAAREYLTGTYQQDGETRRYYPRTSFDGTPDGLGNASITPPFFRTDLAAPGSHAGIFEQVDDFNNLDYTVAMEPTSLLTESGRAFLNVVAGRLGDEIARRYEAVLRDTGVIPEGMAATDVIPFVEVERTDLPVGAPAGPVGRRVAQRKLDDLRAYTDQLPAPAAPDDLDADQVAAGRALFTTRREEGGAGCVACHTADPNQPVSAEVVPIETLYPAYNDELLVLFERSTVSDFSDVQDARGGPAPAYDDSVVALDATLRGGRRGFAQPLLLALDGKARFLHDGSVRGSDARDGLDRLLDPARGEQAPHPFYFPENLDQGDDAQGRAALVEYLRSRTTDQEE